MNISYNKLGTSPGSKRRLAPSFFPNNNLFASIGYKKFFFPNSQFKFSNSMGEVSGESIAGYEFQIRNCFTAA